MRCVCSCSLAYQSGHGQQLQFGNLRFSSTALSEGEYATCILSLFFLWVNKDDYKLNDFAVARPVYRCAPLFCIQKKLRRGRGEHSGSENFRRFENTGNRLGCATHPTNSPKPSGPIVKLHCSSWHVHLFVSLLCSIGKIQIDRISHTI